MSIENFVNCINKMKAGLGAIIWNDPVLLDRAKQLFYSNATIYEDE